MTLKPKRKKKPKNTEKKKTMKLVSRAKVEDAALGAVARVSLQKAGTKLWDTYLGIKVRVESNAVRDISNPSIKGFHLSFFTPNDFDFSKLKKETEKRFSKVEYQGKNVFSMHTQHNFWLPTDTIIR